MKTTRPLPALAIALALAGAAAPSAFAVYPVIDAAGLKQSIVNYAALTRQLTNQATQIRQQLQQIQQFETELKRMGDMATYKKLVGFDELRADLDFKSHAQAWADGLVRVDGRGLWGDTRGGVFVAIEAQFPDFDGKVVVRAPGVFKEAHAVVAAVDEFKAVQADILARRDALKRAIARTGEAMQAASTAAEQQKLQAVIEAQYGQLAAVDGELTQSAAAIQAKLAEGAAMERARQQAEVETRRHLVAQEADKMTEVFRPATGSALRLVEGGTAP
jgi:type IV secretion system protein TrbJ